MLKTQRLVGSHAAKKWPFVCAHKKQQQQQGKSDKYADDQYEYRHVILPKEQAKNIPSHRLLSDAEWRALGVQQSRGWMHYATHRPEPHILLFRRPLGTDPTTGEIRADLAEQARKEFEAIYGRRDEVA